MTAEPRIERVAKKPGSLRRRLVLAAGLSSLAALLIAALILTVLFQRHVESWVDSELKVHLDQLIAGFGPGPDGALEVLRPPGDSRFQKALSGLYWQLRVEPEGPVFRSRSLWDFELAPPAPQEREETVTHRRLAGPGGTSLYGLERRVALPPAMGDKTVTAIVAIDAAELNAAAWRFASVLVPFLLLIGLLLGAAAWAQVSIGLRPLSRLRAKLAEIRSGKAERIGSGFPEEVAPLAQEIDTLLDAQGRQMEKARGQAADLAHGLKTSLQVLTGEADKLRRKGESEAADEILSLAEDMQRHVTRQLTRARLAPATSRATADVAAVAKDVRAVLAKTVCGAKLDWQIAVPEGLIAPIERQDLAEALGNLMDNAARHGKSTVRIEASQDETSTVITVSDDGPGVPDAHLSDVLRRGTRLDSAGPGSGLGLAIVADIAEAWGGKVELRNRHPGLAVSLILPRAG
ncbi:HAMP domain-containing sensor histidine kinase [Methyloligella sp. 2.7D]|uniref:sensor histidine kinase n=1 Tax=unclassified Methyloligella TaxID=2625955 RepID=UPI00157C998A|nr:HAMP domain-containing sensor histidine kinase [Methyloligella sp. GL2]QKP78402.1 HAMP domain-containing histidine kinase [Methyloligella sp. GL2]